MSNFSWGLLYVDFNHWASSFFFLNFIFWENFHEIIFLTLTHTHQKKSGEWWWNIKDSSSVIHLVCSTLLMYVVTRIAAMKYWRRNLHFLLSLMPNFISCYFDITCAQRVRKIFAYIHFESLCLEKIRLYYHRTLPIVSAHSWIIWEFSHQNKVRGLRKTAYYQHFLISKRKVLENITCAWSNHL